MESGVLVVDGIFVACDGDEVATSYHKEKFSQAVLQMA
jgi:hypothetical protein